MTLLQILDASGLALLAAQSGWIVLLHRRLGHLRTTLDSAGAVIGQLDAAAQRLDASSGGIARKVKDGLTEVDGKLAACRHIAQELTLASRNAEEVAARLDQALRQNFKLNNARTAAPARENVEPLGFAARLSTRGETPRMVETAGPAPVALAQRLLAEELTRAPLPQAPVTPEPFPVRAERSVRVNSADRRRPDRMPSLPTFSQAAANPRRRLFGPRLGLPLMALGIAALVPARIASLLPLFDAPVSVAAQRDRALPDLAPGPTPGVGAAGQPVPLREGVLAVPTLSVLLAGPARANPVGEDHESAARLLAEVARRQAETERRERMIEARETRATAAEALARGQLATLGKLRDEMERLVMRETTAADADIDSLVALYVNMRPQQAAKVLERLEAPRAATILLKIPERQAGPIMAQMDPQAALLVTQEIAGRREAFRRNPA